jgi:hypothetical protein
VGLDHELAGEPGERVGLPAGDRRRVRDEPPGELDAFAPTLRGATDQELVGDGAVLDGIDALGRREPNLAVAAVAVVDVERRIGCRTAVTFGRAISSGTRRCT